MCTIAQQQHFAQMYSEPKLNRRCIDGKEFPSRSHSILGPAMKMRSQMSLCLVLPLRRSTDHHLHKLAQVCVQVLLLS